MKRFRKIYLEISNICNLSCSFCPGTKRKKQILQQEDFVRILECIRPWTDYLYFHLMGEPLCHPNLRQYLQLAADAGFKVIITTNGSLLGKMGDILIDCGVHKINVSLHAFEANDLNMPFADYIRDCITFGKKAEGKAIVSYRLWNGGGADALNGEIIKALQSAFAGEWVNEPRGTRLGQRVYLEYGDKFDWPDMNAEDMGQEVYCYGLQDQIGILCDGTVVPCCLDHEGDIALGNILMQSLDEILTSDRALALQRGLKFGQTTEELCRKCGYARRFSGL